MSSEIAIKVESLSKSYAVYSRPKDRLLQMLFRSKKQFYTEFKAVQTLSFEIKKGETVGIIGRNGSGKSTLLQMICGTLNPTAGTVTTNGRIAALLELGSGFNPEFTGRENVYLNAAVFGLTPEETNRRFGDIVAFADIGDFIEQPVKTYSSGMLVRLAFGVIANIDADILIIDEALSVGDAFFTQKCMRYLRNFMRTGTVLFVSHDMSAVVNLCNRALLLENGCLSSSGTPEQVAKQYLAKLYAKDQAIDVAKEPDSLPSSSARPDEEEYRDFRDTLLNSSTLRNEIEVFRFTYGEEADFGAGGATILSVKILDQQRNPLSWVLGGKDVILEIRCKATKEISGCIVGFHFKDRLGQVIFSDNTYLQYQLDPPIIHNAAFFKTEFKFRMPILPAGDYSISPAVAEGTQTAHVQHHWIHDALIIRVHSSSVCLGLIGLPMQSIELSVEPEAE